MNGRTQDYLSLSARVLISLIFLISGFSKLADWSGTAAYMSSKGMPAIPFLLAMAILFEIGGGISVLLGYRIRLAAVALVLFLIPTTLIFHNFWALEGMEQQNQMHHFLKNLAIMGGLMMMAAWGAGAIALDAASPLQDLRAAGRTLRQVPLR